MCVYIRLYVYVYVHVCVMCMHCCLYVHNNVLNTYPEVH